MVQAVRLMACVCLLSPVSFAVGRFSGGFSAQSFGSVAVGGRSQGTLSFTFTNLTAQPSFSLAYGAQFAAGAPTCNSNLTTCTVPVTFSPTVPGTLEDGMLAKDASGNLLATEFISGVGQGPAVTLIPGVVSPHGTTGGIDYLAAPAVDPAGNIYYAGEDFHLVNKWIRGGRTTQIAGNAGGSGAVSNPIYSGPPTGVQLGNMQALAVDAAGNLYIGDDSFHVVRMIDAASGNMSTVAGTGTAGNSGDGGAATSANLTSPDGFAVDLNGNLYIADSSSNVVRKVDVSGNISTIAGTGTPGYTGDGGAGTSARLNAPQGIAVDAAGNVYIADSGNAVVRKITVGTGILSTFAGTGATGFSGDGGAATNAQLYRPFWIGVTPTGTVYIGDKGNSYSYQGSSTATAYYSRVRAVDGITGIIQTIAGSSTGTREGPSSTGTFLFLLSGLAVDSSGNLYVTYNDGLINGLTEFTFSSAEMDIASTPVGQAGAPQALTVWNSGNLGLNLSSPIGVAGTNPSEFAESDNCGSSVAASATCTVSVTFTPAAQGPRRANLNLTDNAPGSPQSVILNGVGGPNAITLFIDTPSSVSGPLLGMTTFSGWALGGATTITNLEVLVDGIPVGTATYGLSRPDVCAVFPNQPGCPSVGWSFNFDTTKIASEGHRLELTATTATGQHASVGSTFIAANWIGPSVNPMLIGISNPSTLSSAFSGTAAFSGFAFDFEAAISNVAVAIDGVSYGNASYGSTFGPPCAASYAGQGCNIGWSVPIDTTALTDGPHTLEVTATAITGLRNVATAPFTVANLSSQTPIHVVIDAPNGQSGPLSGGAHFGGWAVDDNNVAITGVSILVDGVFFGNAQYGGNRPDVCTALPGRIGCPLVGWDLLVDTTLLANGSHALEVTAVAGDGTRATIATSFTVANSTLSNPTRVFVDVPSGQAPVLQGVTAISGWAINDNAAIGSVALFIDGNAYGNANYGTSRPDVCTAFPNRAGCPLVGWNLLLDTTALANGTHTLTASAEAANGQRNVLSTTFTVANWTTAGNPFRVFVDLPSSTSAPLTGTSAMIAGWAINDNAAIASVAVSVDGLPVGAAAYGVSRNDVCAAFAGRPGCPNVGWTLPLDSTMFADGPHDLDVTATSVEGQSYTAIAPFNVANLGTPSGIRVQIDIPSLRNTPFSGSAAFGGWAISDNQAAITKVTVAVDGAFVGDALYGGSRTDVCAAFADRQGCPNVGWTFVLDTTQYANGLHNLDVSATDATGKRATQSSGFFVSN